MEPFYEIIFAAFCSSTSAKCTHSALDDDGLDQEAVASPIDIDAPPYTQPTITMPASAFMNSMPPALRNGAQPLRAPILSLSPPSSLPPSHLHLQPPPLPPPSSTNNHHAHFQQQQHSQHSQQQQPQQPPPSRYESTYDATIDKLTYSQFQPFNYCSSPPSNQQQQQQPPPPQRARPVAIYMPSASHQMSSKPRHRGTTTYAKFSGYSHQFRLLSNTNSGRFGDDGLRRPSAGIVVAADTNNNNNH